MSDESNFEAYHGTDSENVESIKSTGFKISTSLNEWLGDGIYFFIEGISDPIVNSREWAISSAWNKRIAKNIYTHYSILKANVSGNRVLDLRVDDDFVAFNELRAGLLKKYSRENFKFKNSHHPDTFLCNSISKLLGVDILISNLYIKDRQQRIRKIDSRLPNTTVLCAKPSSNIATESIQEVETKEI